MAEVTTPKMVEAPKRAAPPDASKYAEEVRSRRGDVSQMQSRLAFFGEREGWTRRWVLDNADRIPSCLRDGWRFVEKHEVEMSDAFGYGSTDMGNQISIITSVGAGPVRQVLMEIPTEIYNEIMQIRVYDRNNAIEDSIRNGSVGSTGAGHRYNPGEQKGSSFFGTINSVGRKAA